MSASSEYLTCKEAAQLCGFSVAAFHQRRLRGTGPAFIKLGERCVRYARKDVLSWLDSHRQAPTAPKGGSQ